ncbi:hypothetical protein EYC80_003937 [Monilinia laxa]|uniref:Uncharacterized protein n=1 Tax=Monilinia laxa TaxID=61186 RepID=A0A5N6KL87_MONLA|nr:hypothetical protein EYC80_003937 [Monilinia laxa]
MASNCNNYMENNTGSSSTPCHPVDAMPVSLFDAIPTQITPAALLTIPFISILIGVSALHPTKPVYAIYSPSTSSLEFVHGDGTLISPLSVCPLLSFNNGNALCSRQRLNMYECISRSSNYYGILNNPPRNEDGIQEQDFRGPFTNENSVKEAMTYVSDLRFGPDCMAALRPIPLDRHLIKSTANETVPCSPLTADPIWNFSVHHPDFTDVRLNSANESKLSKLFQTFTQRYRNHMPYLTFKKAAYILSGMEKVGAIYWKGEQEKAETRMGWTVDDFLARFSKYEQFTREWKFLYAPNPIAWLEAEMADELRREIMGRERRKMPWMGLIEDVKMVGVVGWDALAEFDWYDGKNGRGYPRRFTSQEEKEWEGIVDNIDDSIENGESERSEMRSSKSNDPKYVSILRKGGHGKNGKRSREERGEIPAIKRSKPVA